MSVATDTVADRIDAVRTAFTPLQLALGAAAVVLVAGALLFGQGAALHDTMHDFRHAAGVVCH